MGIDAGGDSDAFPALEPECIERFLELVDGYEQKFASFFDLLNQVNNGAKSADLVKPCWDALNQQCIGFKEAVDQLFGPPDRSPFSAFVHFCFHEIDNLITPLLATAGEGEELGKQFDNAFLPNRAHIEDYFELLKQGQPALERVNLKDALQDMAAQRRVNFCAMPSYDSKTHVRLAPVALSAVLDNLQRGANQVNGGNAAIHLVLDSGFDKEDKPWVHLHFLSDAHETFLTPERFEQLLTRRPEKGQQGGLGLHLSELLLQAQQKYTNVFGTGLPKDTPRTPPCLHFRQAESSAPLTDLDQAMIQDLNLSTNFLFTIDLTGMRVLTQEERFDCMFDEAVEGIWSRESEELEEDDPLLPALLARARGDLFALFSGGGDLSHILNEVPEDDDALRRDFSRLVLELRQRLERVSA